MYPATKTNVGVYPSPCFCREDWIEANVRTIGAAAGNIIAAIMTIQKARKSGAVMPIVALIINAIALRLKGERRPARGGERDQRREDDVALPSVAGVRAGAHVPAFRKRPPPQFDQAIGA